MLSISTLRALREILLLIWATDVVRRISRRTRTMQYSSIQRLQYEVDDAEMGC